MGFVMNRPKRSRWFVVVLAVLSATAASHACQIPVFRFALERWDPDAYQLVVVHRGELDKTARAHVAKLQAAAASDTEPVNLKVLAFNLDQAGASELNPEFARKLVKKYGQLKQPTMLLYYPGTSDPQLAYSAELNDANVSAVIDSPARKKIVKQLLAGDTAVWVLIESGNRRQDDAAEKTLRRELDRMEKELELPAKEILVNDEFYKPDTQVELRIGFSIVRIGRNDPVEKPFAATLLGSEPELREIKQPIAIPIFGRGRTYYAVAGKGINADNVEETCRFLTGACSCQVKRQNPGTDMLMAVHWDEKVVGPAMPGDDLPVLTGLGPIGIEIHDLEDPESDDSQQQSTVSAADSSNGSSDVKVASLTTRSDVSQPSAAADDSATAMGKDESSDAAGGGMLLPHMFGWLLGGAALALAVVLAGSIWMMRSQHASWDRTAPGSPPGRAGRC